MRAASPGALVMAAAADRRVFHEAVLPSLVGVPELMPSHSSLSAPNQAAPNEASGRSTAL